MIIVNNTVKPVDTGSSTVVRSTVVIEDRTILDDAADNNIIITISNSGDMSFDSTYSYTDIYTNSIPTTNSTELDGNTEKLVNNAQVTHILNT